MQQETFPPSTEKSFFLKGECWRSALYMVIGAAIACGLFPWGLSIQGRLSVLNLSIGFLIFAPCFIVGISLLLPRLTIDSKGIHRRIFYGLWDTWEWERFQPGIIREGFHLDSYLCREKPFWSCKLNLNYYPESVRETVQQIFRQSVADTGIVVPESIEITLDSRTWRFDESGITVNGANSEISHRWIDIEKVTVQKLTHDHLNFRKLSLSLPDDELKLSSNMEERQAWKGSEAERILSFLQTHIPEVRWRPPRFSVNLEQFRKQRGDFPESNIRYGSLEKYASF